MLLFIEIPLAVIPVCTICFLAIGYWAGINQKNKIQKKIHHLESEMLQSHAEILRLSKEIAEQEKEQNKSLVVALHETVLLPTKLQHPAK